MALALLLGVPPHAGATPPALRDVLVVGNNWDGTADVVDPHALKVVTRLNIVPDLKQRTAEIAADPLKLGFFTGVNLLIGEGHNQYVDDAFTSPDGRFLYVSRPSLADVVAFDLGTRQIVWRVPVDGYRSDHMAISPDGRRLLVSASTAGKVHVIDTQRGAIVAEFASGDQPHESNYSADGTRIFHASIGSVYTPLDASALDSLKGKRVFEIVDAQTYAILKRIDVGDALAANGFPGPELRRAADGAVARRALRLPAALLPARLRRVRSADRQARRGSPTCRSPPRPRRCRARATCSTPRTTASR